jgi:hypothetical protein
MRAASCFALSIIVAGTALLLARPAHADVVAAYIEGHGGLSSTEGAANRAATSNGGLAPGLGFQVGARVLIFDGYFDRTAFGSGASVSRGILGLRAGLGTGDLKLVLRGGGGVLFEEGGALAGSQPVIGSRSGVVARAGLAVEKRLTPGQLLMGFGLDGEVFSLENSATSGALAERTQGSDIFLSLQLKFELGI